MTARRRRRKRLANSSTSVGCSTSQTVGEDEGDVLGITGDEPAMSDTTRSVRSTMSRSRKFVSLGLFIIDEFAFADAAGKPNGRSLSPQECAPFIRRFIPRSSSAFCLQNFADWRRRHLCHHWRPRVVRVSHFLAPRRMTIVMPAGYVLLLLF